MPRASKRTTTRAAAAATAASPSRPAKRRKRDPPSSTPAPEPSDVVDADDAIEDDDDDSAVTADQSGLASNATDEVSLITPFLLSPPDAVIQASNDHANSIHESKEEGVQAYAKIAARDWTFYILDTTVNIGRSSDPVPPNSVAARHPLGDADAPSADIVHIDLGPGKVISRQHARVIFDPDAEKWMFEVIGRNGAKVDGVPLKAGATHTLSSGEVIDVGGVEMMFVLPSEISSLKIHSVYRQRCGLSKTLIPPSSSLAPFSQVNAPPTLHQRMSSRSGLPPQLITSCPQDIRRPGTPPALHAYSNNTSDSPRPPGSALGQASASSGLDLSLDDSQHVKPQYSYAQLITQAIMQTADGKLNLNGIYQYIMDNYAYYRFQHLAGWQNSIRHNLSLNKAFDKVARLTDEPGKGMKWQIVPEAKDDMIRNAFRIGRGGHRGSSAPSSPGQLSYISHGVKDMASKEPASTRKQKPLPTFSPSPNTPSHQTVSFDRRLRHAGTFLPAPRRLTRDGSPHSSRLLSATAPAVPPVPESPTITSSYTPEDPPSFVTPAPPRVHLKLAPPSTLQRPSQHMPTSSPAPFWKYADIGSTPLRPSAHFDMSPPRTAGTNLVPSSSPPRPLNRSPLTSPAKTQRQEVQDPLADLKDPPDELGFDLTKGFQSIGSYHAPIGRGAAVGRSMNHYV